MSPEVNLDDSIGLVKNISLENNVGYCGVKLFDFIPQDQKDFYIKGLENGSIQIVSSALGNIDEHGIVRNIKFNYLFLTTESTW